MNMESLNTIALIVMFQSLDATNVLASHMRDWNDQPNLNSLRHSNPHLGITCSNASIATYLAMT